MPSLINDTDNTIINGTTAVDAPNGDIIGIHCIIAHIKKYTFAGRMNWNSSAFGRKVMKLYFVVSTLLSLKRNSLSLRRVLLM